MKKITLTLLILFGFICSLKAQENKTITQVKTVKRVVTKEGSKVSVKEIETLEGEEGAIVVSGNEEEENQTFSEDKQQVGQENVLVDETMVDENNEALIAAAKKRQEEELIKSKEAAIAKAEAQRKAIAQQEKARQDALKAYRKKLEHRGRGTGKLDRRKRN